MKIYSIYGDLNNGFELEKYNVLHVDCELMKFVIENGFSYFENGFSYFENLNNIRRVSDNIYIIWFLDEKMINRYFEALKKRIINDIDEQINDLKKEKTIVSNSKLIKEDET